MFSSVRLSVRQRTLQLLNRLTFSYQSKIHVLVRNHISIDTESVIVVLGYAKYNKKSHETSQTNTLLQGSITNLWVCL